MHRKREKREIREIAELEGAQKKKCVNASSTTLCIRRKRFLTDERSSKDEASHEWPSKNY